MTTLQGTHRTALKARTASATIIAALGALIAVGVSILFLALADANATKPTAHKQPSTYYPLIQYRGSGAPPVAHLNQSGATNNTSADRPAEHFYGAQP